MKLKKVLSGIMAAVMAVTSSVVMTVSAGAETGNGTHTFAEAVSVPGWAEVKVTNAEIATALGSAEYIISSIDAVTVNYTATEAKDVTFSHNSDEANGYWVSETQACSVGENSFTFEKPYAFNTGDDFSMQVSITDSSITISSIDFTCNYASESISAANFEYSILKDEEMEIGDTFTITFDSTKTPAAAKYCFKYKYTLPNAASDTYYIVVADDGTIDNGASTDVGVECSKATSGNETTYTFTAVSASATNFAINVEFTASGTWGEGYTQYPWFGDVSYKVLPATYAITAGEATGGEISFANAEGTAIIEALEGDVVTVKVTPADGYKLDGFTTDVTITETEGVYTFEMPADAVTITPVFKAITVEEVAVTAAATSVVVGGTTKVTATVTPEDALDPSVIWASSDTAVATVDADGTVKALTEGKVTITATSNDSKDAATPVKGSVDITVTADENPATAIALDKTEASIKMDETVTLTATVTAKDTNKACTDSVIWQSAEEKIATVKDGVVTPVALGTTTITVTAGEKSATCKITVAATPVEKITLAADSTTITVGDTATVTATVTPDKATDKTVSWSSSDEKVATVADGKVTAVTAGKATITATAKDGSKVTGTIDITVEEAPAELADPVLPDVKYGEIVTTKSGEFTFAKDDKGELITSLLQLQTAACYGDAVFNEDDILMLAITTDVATATDKENGWQMAFNGFTPSWGGWSAACSDKGTLTYYATVADVMKANKMTSISELGGVIFQVWGGNVGDSLKYVLAHATAPAADEEDETLDKGTYGAGTGSYKELPANEIPQMTMGKDNVETEGYTETSKAYFEDDKLFIFQCVDEAALEGKSQATVVVQHKNGKALKMTSTGVYKTLKADVPAEDGKLYVAFVISGVTNDATADAYYGNFQWSDITIS